MFLKNIAELIKVKTIITLMVVGVFSYLAMEGKIESKDVMVLVFTIISFYFGTQNSKTGGTQ